MRFSWNFFSVWLWCPALLWAQSPVGVVSSGDAKLSGTATMVPGGLQVAGGTDITAQKFPADLRLSRGGQLRLCPGTKVTVNSSRDGQELQFSMGGGSVEANYALGPHGDTFLTPDLRIVVSGPGPVDLIVGTDSAGNSCIENRGADAPYVLVSQLIGDGVYRVQSNGKILLPGGRVDRVQLAPTPCGCPQFRAPTEVGIPGKQDPAAQLAQNHMADAESGATTSQTTSAGTASLEAPLPRPSPGDVRIQVDAPLVFDARAPGPTTPEASEQEPRLAAIRTGHRNLSDLPINGLPALQPQAPRATVPNTNPNAPIPVRVLHAFRRFFGKLFGD